MRPVQKWTGRKDEVSERNFAPSDFICPYMWGERHWLFRSVQIIQGFTTELFTGDSPKLGAALRSLIRRRPKDGESEYSPSLGAMPADARLRWSVSVPTFGVVGNEMIEKRCCA